MANHHEPLAGDTTTGVDGRAFFMEAFLPGNRANPYDLYRRTRERGGLLAAGSDMHLAFGHEACWALLRHPLASSDERSGTDFRRQAELDPRVAALVDAPQSLLFMDPPDHDRLRELVARGFTPRRIAELRVAMQSTTDVDPSILRSEDDERGIAEATTSLHDHTAALLAERRRHPGDDLLSVLLTAHDQHGGSDCTASGVTASGVTAINDTAINESEMIELVTLLLVAGHQTTVNLIGNGLLALLAEPAQLQLLRDGRS